MTCKYLLSWQCIWVRVMVFNATFNNISVLLVEENGETHDLPQVTDKLYHIMLY